MKINPQQFSQKGFTLVELIIFTGLMSFLLAVIMGFFATIIELRLETEATSSVEQDSKFIYSRLLYDIQRASTITTPAFAGQTGSTLGITIGAETFTYALVNGKLQLTTPMGTSNLNGYNTTIDSITFEHLENNLQEKSIRVTYTIASITLRNGTREQRTIQTTFGFR